MQIKRYLVLKASQTMYWVRRLGWAFQGGATKRVPGGWLWRSSQPMGNFMWLFRYSGPGIWRPRSVLTWGLTKESSLFSCWMVSPSAFSMMLSNPAAASGFGGKGSICQRDGPKMHLGFETWEVLKESSGNSNRTHMGRKEVKWILSIEARRPGWHH